ncbi:2-keto-4-pentenoate hydratase/2-oxohepta-3-ene-17-dioic acid hydratase (catechol pathway) [Rubrobacter radiotolerans]|uniref:2-keto-4-pentenoate hydratase/2-oxohepta-3-ene-17-dioic acid hydratase (Catechol pathway) n=1 Tax=Rubrobacter radiotolerans TaxID=42256 RepID=A0A023X1J6_RUBRA|nr:2-keto-4-pentenoate hydratase/2-oxohepta-3-ene-17-dioic acid hydratase (catechol pathway) [Rubrobacter radiotolerans]SMC03465.1 2-keto-4-pentenoate hydratase/2-oxohepta-3-ene-1,7-dioic acid hydratase (catechol pathway) [Rubrobacter radiotolerans DSM 5868]
MKLVCYSQNGGGPKVGILEGETIVPLMDGDVLDHIKSGKAEPGSGSESGTVPLSDVRLLAPIRKPEKFIGIGLNYSDHAAETGAEIPDKPIVFAKYANSIVGPDEPVVIPPITEKADYEAELAVVIGREAKNVSAAEALDYVFGYTNCNDVSARDLQFSEGGQWTRSKSIDTFAPIGPFIATADEVPDPQNLSVRLTLNGEVVQDGSTAKMIFPVSELIEFLSSGMTLSPGDIISTGTPPGVGSARTPQLFLKPGDSMTVEIEGLGSLTNPVK